MIRAAPHQPLPEGVHIGFGLDAPERVELLHEELATVGRVRLGHLEDHRGREPYVTFRCWDPDGTEIEVFWEEPSGEG